MSALNKDHAYRLLISYNTDVVDSLNGNTYGVSRGVAVSDSNFSHGFTNPSWKYQVKHGINATTDLVAQRYTDAVTWASYEAHGKIPALGRIRALDEAVYGSALAYPLYATAVLVPSSVVTDVTNRCIRKFIDRALSASSSTNLTGRSIRHFQHDVHSLIHPMTSLREKISSYLTRLEKASLGFKNKRSPSWLKVVRNEYLQFSFGLKPFATDITDILSDISRKHNDVQPISASSSQTFQGSIVPFNYSLNAFALGTISGVYKVTSVYSVKMKGAIRNSVGSDGTVSLLQENRLLPKDWLPTAFSILPYAWLVDYFTNIGDIIEGLSFPSSSLAWGSRNIKTVNKVVYNDPTITFNENGNPDWFDRKVSGNGGNAVFTFETLSRDPLTPDLLIPRFEIKIPTSVPKLLNMMAVFQPRIFKLTSGLISKF